MSYLQYVPPALFGAVVAFYLGSLVYYYATVEPMPVGSATPAWRRVLYRLLASGRNSATLLWNKLCVVGGALVGLLAAVAQVADAPEVSSAIHTYFTPEVAAGVLVAVLVVSNLARVRTLPRE